MMNIRRGDIYYISGGKTYAGYAPLSDNGRPGIIVSSDELNENGQYVEVVYLTTQDKKPMSTHCNIVCKQNSTAMCETVYTVNKDRVGDFVRVLTDSEMRDIDHCLKESLGLTDDHEEPRTTELTDIEVERNLYKRLYEQLLSKVVS